jgi:osmotically inducible protein OsmC
MATDRSAQVTWNGSLIDGSGRIDSVGSGAFGPLDVTWASRTEEPAGRDQLLGARAAAHAACFSMALSHALATAGTPPEELKTGATVAFEPGEGITKIALTVRGTVPGIDEDGFRKAAEDAKDGCPVSQAVAGVPEITVEASLA